MTCRRFAAGIRDRNHDLRGDLGLTPPGYDRTAPTEWDIGLCWGLGKRAWVYFVHYIHLVRTDFDRKRLESDPGRETRKRSPTAT